MPRVSLEFIELHITSRGAYTQAQIISLGEPWPPIAGWKFRAVERELSQAAIDDFVRFKSRHQATQYKREQRQAKKGIFGPPRPLGIKKHGKPRWKKKEWVPVLCDGVRVESDSFLQTYEWRRVRMVALKKYGARCQCCGATPADGASMNVDHIKPRRLYPSLALDVNNLQVLCHECNHGKGNWDMTDWRAVEALG